MKTPTTEKEYNKLGNSQLQNETPKRHRKYDKN